MQIFGKSEQVQTTGAQLYPEVVFTSLYKDYATMSGLNNGIITIIGTNKVSGGRNTIKTPSFLLSSGTYTVSFSGRKECELFLVNEANNINIVTDTQNNFELLEETSVHFGINGVSGKNYNDEFRIMLNSGDVSLPYEPYTGGKPSPSPEYPQEITSAGDNGTLEVKIADSSEKSRRLILSTPNGLPGIPVSRDGNYTDENGQQWVCDEIDLEREVRIQRVIKMTFDGSDDEGWSLYDVHKGFYSKSALPEDMECRNGYCNKLRIATNSDHYGWSSVIRLGARNKVMYCINVPFYNENLSDCGLSNWKAYLAEIPMEVITYVTTPITAPLTPEEISAYKSLHTYSGTTLIANDSGAGMSLTYTVDTKKYVDKKIAAISAAMIGG